VSNNFVYSVFIESIKFIDNYFFIYVQYNSLPLHLQREDWDVGWLIKKLVKKEKPWIKSNRNATWSDKASFLLTEYNSDENSNLLVFCALSTVVANISEMFSASIFRLKKSKKSVWNICHLQHYFSHVQMWLEMRSRIIWELSF